jgi:acylphosphatase
MSAVRYDVTFTGHVQGVWFRATTRDVSRDFGVTGWVRNEPDGSVRCVAEGEPTELDRFITAVQRARREYINDTRIEKADATGEFPDFSIRY